MKLLSKSSRQGAQLPRLINSLQMEDFVLSWHCAQSLLRSYQARKWIIGLFYILLPNNLGKTPIPLIWRKCNDNWVQYLADFHGFLHFLQLEIVLDHCILHTMKLLFSLFLPYSYQACNYCSFSSSPQSPVWHAFTVLNKEVFSSLKRQQALMNLFRKLQRGKNWIPIA